MAFAAALAGPGAASAAAPLRGELDRSFGQDGGAALALGPTFANSYFEEMVRQPDGGIVLAGRTEVVEGIYNEPTGFVQRRGPTGALDTGFGGGFVQVPAVGGLALQDDGKVLVGAPIAARCSPVSTVRRLGPDGVPDPSFGKGGTSDAISLASSHVAVDSQGRVVVAGVSAQGSCPKMGEPPLSLTLARLLPNGSLDPGFGQGGVVALTAAEDTSGTGVGGLVIREDDSIVVAGYGELLAVASTGAADSGFGTGGAVEVGGTQGALLGLSDGKLVLASSTAEFCCDRPGDFVIGRYLPNGSPDPGFGGDGSVELALGKVDTPTALAAGPEGSVLLGGETANDDSCPSLFCDATPVLVRFASSGALDPGFGQAGRAPLSMPRRSRTWGKYAAALDVTPDGQILIAGGSGEGGNATVSALRPTGAPDPGFGPGGSVADIRTLPSVTSAHDLAIAPDGHVLVSAWSDSGSHHARSVFLAPGGEAPVESGTDGELQVDGRGRFYSFTGGYRGVGRGHVARFDEQGRRDPGYGSEGKAFLPDRFDPEALVVRRNGQALVVGRVAKRFGMAAFMLSPGGHPIRRFGGDGLAIVGFGPKVRAKARTGAFDRRGRVVLFGDHASHAGMARLLPNGRPDPSFAYHGRQYYWPGLANEESAVAFAPNGGILVAAAPERDISPLPTTLIRFRPDGIRDRSFGRNGVVRVNARASMVGFFAGRRLILVSGTDGFGDHGVAIRAFKRDGSPDRRFGRRGVVKARTEKGRFFRPAAAARQPDGRIVVAGTNGKIEESGSTVELLRFR